MTIEQLGSTDTIPRLVDRDLAEITDFSERELKSARASAERAVETELSLACERPQLDQNNRCDARTALPYLDCMRRTIEEILREEASRYSKARWLWMLRRLPDPVFEGKMSTTRAYDSALAEAISGMFGSTRTERPFVDDEGSTRFRLDGAPLPRLLRFAALTKWLSQSHVLLRYSGKGVGFEFLGNSALPEAVPTKQQQESIKLYDHRVSDTYSFLTRTGTVVSAEAAMSEANGFVTVHFSGPEWLQVPVRINGKELEVQVLKRFVPQEISLLGLEKLNSDAGLAGLTWWKPHAASVLALARGTFAVVAGSTNGLASMLRYGYAFSTEERFLEIMAANWDKIAHDVVRIIPNGKPPKSAEELFASLLAIEPTLWPLSPGPVIRRTGDMIWIDLVSCTAILERSLEFPLADGKVGNARADHFEEATQETINASNWKPSPELPNMVHTRIKRLDGTELTDLDALGENGRRLLLVSCKSLIYSALYDAGNYDSVRNVRTTVEDAVRKWSDVANYLKAHPKAPTYDFSGYASIIPLVCTPHVAYVDDPYAERFVESGLHAACSLSELSTWLTKNGVDTAP